MPELFRTLKMAQRASREPFQSVKRQIDTLDWLGVNERGVESIGGVFRRNISRGKLRCIGLRVTTSIYRKLRPRDEILKENNV